MCPFRARLEGEGFFSAGSWSELRNAFCGARGHRDRRPVWPTTYLGWNIFTCGLAPCSACSMAGKSRGLPCGAQPAENPLQWFRRRNRFTENNRYKFRRSTWRGNLLPSVVAKHDKDALLHSGRLPSSGVGEIKGRLHQLSVLFQPQKHVLSTSWLNLRLADPPCFWYFLIFRSSQHDVQRSELFFCHHALLQGGWLRQPVMCKGCWRVAVRLWKHCCHFFSNCRFQRAGLRRWNVLWTIYW